MEYWIVEDNTHAGPFTAQELKEKQIGPDTYVWYRGLKQWTLACEIAELADCIYMAPPQVTEESQTEMLQTEGEAPTETVCEVSAENATLNEASDKPEIAEHAPEFKVPLAPPFIAPQAPVAPQFAPASAQGDQSVEEKCPPTYLAWSIITTIIFFLPLGVVAIIYSSMVKKRWYLGQTERARHASEMAAWFSNASFVAGLIAIPFQIVFSMI